MKFIFKINGRVISIRDVKLKLKRLRFRLAVWLAGENTILNDANVNINNVCISSNSQFFHIGSNVHIGAGCTTSMTGIEVSGSLSTLKNKNGNILIKR